MHIYNQTDYPNLLLNISISSDEIKCLVSTYRLTFLPDRNKEVEWGIKLPMFVDAFYDYVVVYQTIPAQEEFFEYYLDYNKDYFNNLNRPDLEIGIKARAYRTYPSLVRDIYFNKYIQEKLGTRCQIIYNTKLDIEEGIDLMIITSKGIYGVCFYTNTKRAFAGRKAKENRHILFNNVKYIEMPLEFQGSVRAGDFFLYGEKEYIELYNTLSK